MGEARNRQSMDIGALRQSVEREIDTYEYQVPENPIGMAWPSEKVKACLQDMRASLVDPYWVDVTLRDTFEQVAAPDGTLRSCVVVADDGKGTLLVFDTTENEFMLAQKLAESLVSFGVRGDAVGCFLGR